MVPGSILQGFVFDLKIDELLDSYEKNWVKNELQRLCSELDVLIYPWMVGRVCFKYELKELLLRNGKKNGQALPIGDRDNTINDGF